MPTDRPCETCRFWNVNGDGPTLFITTEDGYEEMTGTQRRCLKILHGNGGDNRAREATVAFVNDGSGYAASLYTLPTFGCSLWEASDADRR